MNHRVKTVPRDGYLRSSCTCGHSWSQGNPGRLYKAIPGAMSWAAQHLKAHRMR